MTLHGTILHTIRLGNDCLHLCLHLLSETHSDKKADIKTLLTSVSFKSLLQFDPSQTPILIHVTTQNEKQNSTICLNNVKKRFHPWI